MQGGIITNFYHLFECKYITHYLTAQGAGAQRERARRAGVAREEGSCQKTEGRGGKTHKEGSRSCFWSRKCLQETKRR
jgi:hypothetical protein